MASHDSEPAPPAPGLQTMLARLRDLADAPNLPDAEPQAAEQPQDWKAPSTPAESIPLAQPVAAEVPVPLAQPVAAEVPVPLAQPVAAEVPVPLAQPVAPDTLLAEPLTVPLALPVDLPLAEPVAEPPEEPPTAILPRPVLPPCPCCQAPRTVGQSYCGDCGFIFPEEELAAPPHAAVATAEAPAGAGRVGDRYEVAELLSEHAGVTRFRGLDWGAGGDPVPVVLVRAAVPMPVEAITVAAVPESSPATEEVLPTFDVPPLAAEPVAEATLAEPPWPGLAWEKSLLEQANHPALPRLLDQFTEAGYDYLVIEAPEGQTLWDAWDDPEADAAERYGWLQRVAEALHALHQAGAILEGLRPDAVVVNADNQVRFTDLSGLLPLPVPAAAPIRATHYTAPELIFDKERADARADLYHFGAMLFSLHVGRELVEMDFERQGVPKEFFPLYPEIHPLFGRLMVKTFCRDLAPRFPTEEAAKEDASGFTELLRTLEVCGRVLDRVRLETAAWTSTGMVRTGNEDACALLHGVQAHEDELIDTALVLLCDGMGGYEAGEVAARLTIEQLRKILLAQRPFSALLGEFAFEIDVEGCKRQLEAALKDVNQHIWSAARSGIGRRGMGCTAEVVYISGKHLFVGHVGDSRVYLLHQNQLTQITRDHTLVNRLVELGQLTPEEAITHPRRSELQQAIGGHPNVEVELHHRLLQAGDFVVVCSDGLSNHVLPKTLKEMLTSSGSAEVAARRLVNLVNLEGATDNATVVVLRAT